MATIPGKRVRRLVKGFEKFRRVRRSRKELIQPIIDPSSESEPPGPNPSAEEEWPDPNYVDSDLEDDVRVREGPGGDSLTESITGSYEPKPLRKILKPSRRSRRRHLRFSDTCGLLPVCAMKTTTIHPLGLLVGCSPALTMAAAGALQFQQAIGNPCKPKP